MTSLGYFQLTMMGCWGVTCVLCCPAFVREVLWRGGGATNPWRAAIFLVGLIFVVGPARALFRPNDILTYKIIYALASLLAIYTWALFWNERRK